MWEVASTWILYHHKISGAIFGSAWNSGRQFFSTLAWLLHSHWMSWNSQFSLLFPFVISSLSWLKPLLLHCVFPLKMSRLQSGWYMKSSKEYASGLIILLDNISTCVSVKIHLLNYLDNTSNWLCSPVWFPILQHWKSPLFLKTSIFWFLKVILQSCGQNLYCLCQSSRLNMLKLPEHLKSLLILKVNKTLNEVQRLSPLSASYCLHGKVLRNRSRVATLLLTWLHGLLRVQMSNKHVILALKVALLLVAMLTNKVTITTNVLKYFYLSKQTDF